MALSIYWNNILRFIGLLLITQFMNCEPLPAETYTIINEMGEKTKIRFKVKIDEVTIIGTPLYKSNIKLLVIGSATLYSDCNYQQEKGAINFFNPINDDDGYTDYFSQKVSFGLIESGPIEIYLDHTPLYPRNFGILTHHLIITEINDEKQRCFSLRSASIISKGGINITTVIVNARIYVRDSKMMLPLIDEVTERVVQKLSIQK